MLLAATFVALVLPTADVRGDILVSTINFLAQIPADAAGVRRYNQESGTELTLGDVPPFNSEAGPFGPTDVAVGPDGNIYVSDPFTSSILYFDGTTGAPLPSPFGPSFPDGLFAAVSAQQNLTFTSLAFHAGQLYVADAFDKTVLVYNGPNTAMPGVQVDTLLDSPSVPVNSLASIAFDNSGNLLVSDRGDNKVYRVDVATDIDSVIIQAASQQDPPFAPAGIAVGPNDDIFLVDLGGSAILRYDSSGGNRQVFANIPVLPEDIDGGSFPSDIVFDHNGDLLVAVLGGSNVIGSGVGRVLRIDPTGTIVDTIDDMLVPASGIALIDDLVPGDYDGNGIVEPADFGEWKSQFGNTVARYAGADGNGDQRVDLADYTVWRDSLGATGVESPLGQFSSPVPEPGTLVGALVVLVLVARGERQRQRP